MIFELQKKTYFLFLTKGRRGEWERDDAATTKIAKIIASSLAFHSPWLEYQFLIS